MTGQELHYFRKKLTALAARLGQQVTDLRQEALGNIRGEEVADAGELAERESAEERARPLFGSEQQILHEVNSALSRIDNGSFGRCEDCRVKIAQSRLEALPYVRRCAKCAAKDEMANVG